MTGIPSCAGPNQQDGNHRALDRALDRARPSPDHPPQPTEPRPHSSSPGMHQHVPSPGSPDVRTGHQPTLDQATSPPHQVFAHAANAADAAATVGGGHSQASRMGSAASRVPAMMCVLGTSGGTRRPNEFSTRAVVCYARRLRKFPGGQGV